MRDLSILIVEDEMLYASKMEMQLDILGLEHAGTVDNSQDALEILKKQVPDLVLMDINIDGDYDGVELAQMIREQYDIPALFISSLKDDRTFRRAMRVNPIGFLIKPFDEVQLKRMLEIHFAQEENQNVSSEKQSKSSDALLIKKDGKLFKIQQEELLYLNADGRYTFVHTAKGRFHVRKSMSTVVEEDFPTLTLLQSHRSYFVNAAAITEIDLNELVIILGKQSVPLSLRSKDEFLAQWQQL